MLLILNYFKYLIFKDEDEKLYKMVKKKDHYQNFNLCSKV